MTLLCCKGESEWVTQAHSWVQANCSQRNVKRILVPAGETPKPLYAYWEQIRPEILKDKQLVQIDEIAAGPAQGAFQRFFRDYLPSYVSQFEFFESGSQGGDLALLGLGMNGHIAFHEPGLSSDFYSGCVPLSKCTRQVLNLEHETWGATFGVKAIMKADAILLLVRGEKKRDILERVLRREPLPAAALLDHPQLSILCDFEITPPVS